MPDVLQRLSQAPARGRLVRFCAHISGDPGAAEDLAQETLIEAWRNAHKLRDESGCDRWVAAIARNVCRRAARRRARDLAVPLEAENLPTFDADLDTELERSELVDVLDRALAMLPPATRDVLVRRYVDDSPHADIAARLGISEDAVSMRLTRGKKALRRELSTRLGGSEADGGWLETRVWCAMCGGRKLEMRRGDAPNAVTFSCPSCTPGAPTTEFKLDNPSFAQLVGKLVRPAAIIARTGEWTHRYFAAGAGAADRTCTRCAAAVSVRRYSRADGSRGEGLYASCGRCGEEVSSSVDGIALSTPESRRFRREHGRIRALPRRELDFGGIPTIAARYQAVLGSSGVDVLLARDSLRVLAVES